MLREILYACRRLLRDRWSVGAAVLVAALGTGLNTSVFAFAYGVLLRPFPYRDTAHLVVTDGSVPLAAVDDWKRQLHSLERVGAYTRDRFIIRGLDEPRFLTVGIVDGEFFETLGTAPLAGRTFGREDGPDVAVVGERLARQWSAGDSVLGRSVTAGERRLTVIGVMPDAFAVPSAATDIWVPTAAVPPVHYDRASDQRRVRLIGRLRGSATPAQLRADLVRARDVLEPEEAHARTEPPGVKPLADEMVGEARSVLLALAGAAALVLLITCANVATVLIGRTIARSRDLAIRAAIGASRASLFATVVSESLLIGFAGSLAGAGLALVAVRVMATAAAGILPRVNEVRVDWPVVLFAIAVCAATGVAAALPAWRSLDRSTASLRAGTGGSPRGHRIRAVLAASQVALAVVLLAAGALLIRTLTGLLGEEVGVERRGAVVTQVMVTGSTSFDAIGRAAWLDGLLERVRAIPRLSAAGAGSSLPPDHVQLEMTVRLEEEGRSRMVALSLTAITPGFLEALGTPLLRGRYFTDADVRGGELVTVLSESAARELMPGVDPVGRPLAMGLPGMRARGRPTVVGVVRDVKYGGLEAQAGASLYVLWKELPAGQLFLAARTSGDVRALAASLRTSLRAYHDRMPVMPIRGLDETIDASVANRRLRALLGGTIAGLALAIALAGLAGGLGRMVTERRRELAIRAALGASPGRAMGGVMRDGAMVAAGGIVAGTVASLAASALLRAFVFGISPRDPLTLGGVALLVAAGSLLACYLPARRASMANPLDVLRTD